MRKPMSNTSAAASSAWCNAIYWELYILRSQPTATADRANQPGFLPLEDFPCWVRGTCVRLWWSTNCRATRRTRFAQTTPPNESNAFWFNRIRMEQPLRTAA
jgi:hypothetical protein